jgi:hypothetical protein
MAVIDVEMSSTRTGRFDRVIPTVGLVQVGQGPAVAVVAVVRARAGTPVMVAAPLAALDLPLNVLVGADDPRRR